MSSGDQENGLRDSSSLMEEESIEYTTPSNSPMSLSSCARLVSSSASIARIKETPPSPSPITLSQLKTPMGASKLFNSCSGSKKTNKNEESSSLSISPVSASNLSNGGSSLPNSPQGQRLDLPMVYNNLKVDNFRGIKKEPGLLHKTRRRGVASAEESVNKMMSLMRLGDNPIRESVLNTHNLEKNLKAVLKNRPVVETYLADHQNNNNNNRGHFPSTNGGNINLTPSKLSSKAYISNHQHSKKFKLAITTTREEKLQQQGEASKLSEKFCGAFNWARDHAIRDNKELEQMSNEWEEYSRNKDLSPSPKEIADLLILPTEDLLKFKLSEFEDCRLSSLLTQLKSLVNHLAYPDILKMLSFSEWQKGNHAQCTYYASESHGTHLRSDIVDKHCLYFGRKEEHLTHSTTATTTTTTTTSSHVNSTPTIATATSETSSFSSATRTNNTNHKTSKNKNNINISNKNNINSSTNNNNNNDTNNIMDDESAVQSKVFNRQIEDALNFGKTIEEFETRVNQIKFDWNIIQITALSFGNNRFGSEIADWKETPALFLTSFQYLPNGLDKSQPSQRTSFTTFVKQPDVIPGASMQRGIIEEFNKVMIKNRHINDGYQGCRKRYWDIRAEHNRHLGDVLSSIEEHWIFPWAFLFPGNIKDSKIQRQINETLSAVEDYLKRKLTSGERIALYKFIENYQIVDGDTKASLGKFLGFVLSITTTKGNGVANVLNKSGILGTIQSDQRRGPTILILDQELEQLPWDWIPSLRHTSVTRMPSMTAIYSALKVMKYTRPKYPEIIEMTKCSFILNPDQTLKNVQQRLEEYLKDRKHWNGIVGRRPSHHEVEESLKNKDVLIYCGHGNGGGFYPEFALQKILCRATPILMGCSSGQYKYHGPKASSSSIINSYFIAASPSVVGFLWEVTDVECDRVTVDLLERWLPGPGLLPAFPQFDHLLNRPREKCLATAVLRSRKAATQFLTEASLVNYGLPIETK